MTDRVKIAIDSLNLTKSRIDAIRDLAKQDDISNIPVRLRKGFNINGVLVSVRQILTYIGGVI